MTGSEKSKANLKPITSAKMANELREKGLEVRRRNKELREQFAISAKELSEVGAINVLRGLLDHHLAAQDFDKAADIAKSIAEYETPKLQRSEVSQKVDVTDLTPEELEAELAKLK